MIQILLPHPNEYAYVLRRCCDQCTYGGKWNRGQVDDLSRGSNYQIANPRVIISTLRPSISLNEVGNPALCHCEYC